MSYPAERHDLRIPGCSCPLCKTTPDPKEELRKNMHAAVDKYLEAGGPAEFVILSRADLERNTMSTPTTDSVDAELPNRYQLEKELHTNFGLGGLKAAEIAKWCLLLLTQARKGYVKQKACESCDGAGVIIMPEPTGDHRCFCRACDGTGYAKLYTQAELDQKVAEARLDENGRWKVVAEEIVKKDGVYRAVNYLNQRVGELTNPHTPQEQKTPVEEVRYVREQTEAYYKVHGHYSYQHCPISCPGQDEPRLAPPQVDKCTCDCHKHAPQDAHCSLC